MAMLGLTASVKMVANAQGWFRLVLKAEDNPLGIALNFEVRKKRRVGAQ